MYHCIVTKIPNGYGYIQPRSCLTLTYYAARASIQSATPVQLLGHLIMLAGSSRATQFYLRATASTNLVRVPRPAIRLYRTPIPSRFLPLCNFRLFTLSQRRFAEPLNSQDSATTPVPPEQHTSTKQQQPPRRRRRGVFYSAVFLLIGLSLGTLVRLSLAPPPPYPHGSPQDEYHVSKIREEGSALPLVRRLSSDPTWKSWDAYSGAQSSSIVQSRLTTGPLGGSHGLPFQRVFRNTKTNEVISVVYLGAATSGWPGVVHGGALATLLDESLVRCAVLLFPARTAVTARLELQYRAPTLTSSFYLIRARPMIAEGEDLSKVDRKMWVEGTLETLHGKICVEAKALAVVPKGVKLKPLVEEF
ncbi:HotDog domain-containing protein [Daldinia caldariorum]|uniref:HotDog domain-containing protein n=1 Tax=Daldinia caldariorum TaxID=326644 RepID=UPI00200878E9|nr:HotDog domain-containing protein [Daldinia caldariorum]KAI1462889.1 HotDog domain-containing protein [Daldinia caldariorum]